MARTPEVLQRVRQRPELAVGALLVAVFAVIVGRAVAQGWTPSGDLAFTELMVRSVGHHPPTFGFATRIGPIDNQHAHPGPLFAYLLAPVYWLGGSSARALMVATALVHLAAMLGVVAIARRVGGRAMCVATGVALAAMIAVLGGTFFVTPWNPWFAVTGMLVVVYSAWGVLRGDSRLIPVVVGAATFTVQTHLGTLAVVGGLVVVAIVGSVRRRPAGRGSDGAADAADVADRGDRGDRAGRRWLFSFAVSVVAWVPPLIDQLRGTRNLSWIARWLLRPCAAQFGGCAPRAGVGTAMAGMATSAVPGLDRWRGVPAEFTTPRGALVDTAVPWVALVIVLGVGAALAVGAWRRDRREAWPALTVLAVGAVTAAVSLANGRGALFRYVVRWIVALQVFAVAWALVWAWRWGRRWGRGRLGARRGGAVAEHPRPGGAGARSLAPLAAAAVMLPAGVGALAAAVSTSPPMPRTGALVRSLAGPLRTALAALPAEARPAVIRWHDPLDLGAVAYGLVDEVERHGIRLGGDAWMRYTFRPERIERAPVSAVWYVVGERAVEAAAAAAQGSAAGRVIAQIDGRSPADAARATELETLVDRRLGELGRTDLVGALHRQYGVAVLLDPDKRLPADVTGAVEEWWRLGQPVALVILPAAASPAWAGEGAG